MLAHAAPSAHAPDAQLAPAAAGAWQVPASAPEGITHTTPASHWMSCEYDEPTMCPQGCPAAARGPVVTRTHRDLPVASGKHSARSPAACGAHSSFTRHVSPMRLRAAH